MQRHARRHFFAFGLLPALNVVALLIYGLMLSTSGTGNTGRSLVVILGSSVLMLACAVASAIKRGRDLGFTPASTVGAVVVSLLFGPVFLLLVAWFALKSTPEGASQLEEPLGIRWLWSPVLLLIPWAALLVASALR